MIQVPGIRAIVVAMSVVILFGTFVPNEPALASDKATIAYNLAMFLRSARSVVSKNKEIIGDPTKMKFGPDEFVKKAKKSFKKVAGTKLNEADPSVAHLVTAVRDVVTKAKSGGFKGQWETGDAYSGKFLPARFARAVAERFNELVGGGATMKLTAPDKYLVNPANKADDWERKAMNEKLTVKGWAKDKAYSESGEGFRYIIPEYYNSSCMGCHGGAEGTRIHAGKVPGTNGEVGGAISIFLKS